MITESPSVTPWKAPAINGLSSGALQKTTSFAHAMESCSRVSHAASLIICPISITASILMPVFVDPTFTDEQTRSVDASAFGMDLISISSAGVIDFDTSALYPPIKFTPTVLAHSSRTTAISAKSSGVRHAAPPTSAIGVTEMRLLTIGIPYKPSISLPVSTSLSAFVHILFLMFSLSFSRSPLIQSRREMPIVIVRTSRFSCRIILLVSSTSSLVII